MGNLPSHLQALNNRGLSCVIQPNYHDVDLHIEQEIAVIPDPEEPQRMLDRVHNTLAFLPTIPKNLNKASHSLHARLKGFGPHSCCKKGYKSPSCAHPITKLVLNINR